jgi:predicted HAD superfamily Cof-like phosphohydrolase
MSTDLVNDVREFNNKFGVPMHDGPHLLPEPDWQYRVKFLQEEMTEMIEAARRGDGLEVADGLVDLIYVAIGTALIMGIPIQAVWDEVHSANMRKERSPASAHMSKRGHHWDVTKPLGWVGPDLGRLMPNWNFDD